MIQSNKTINFNAGPAALPNVVLQEASKAILDYEGTGMSIISIPHRGEYFDAILEESKRLVKELCELDDSYEVLWLQGGGRMQFAMIPMNFLSADDTAGYIDSGSWSADAIKHALHYGKVNVISSSKQDKYTYIPDSQHIPQGLAYVHITSNNTIYGTQWSELPESKVPLIVDMSSDIFGRRRDYKKCDLFFAAAQKNVGPSGATLVVIKKTMLKHIKRTLPPILNYADHVDKKSVLNTPPVFPIYVSLLTLRWIKQQGIDKIEQQNERKAGLLYDEVERNSLFSATAKKEHRSQMNVCFTAVNEMVEKDFLSYAEECGILNIKGHRSVGGFRASLYNAITVEDVQYLVAVMQEFELNNK